MIGYRIFSSLGSGSDAIQQGEIAVSFKPKPIRQQDTFSINTFNRDPFLGTFKAKPKAKKTIAKAAKKEIQWPDIQYSGSMGDGNTKENIFFVNINNVQYLMKPKDKMQQVELISGSEDRIILRYKGQKKTISLN